MMDCVFLSDAALLPSYVHTHTLSPTPSQEVSGCSSQHSYRLKRPLDSSTTSMKAGLNSGDASHANEL